MTKDKIKKNIRKKHGIQVKNLRDFSEGFAVIETTYGEYYFIDRYLELAFGGKAFKYADSFKEGLAIVRDENWYGFLNKEGSFASDKLKPIMVNIVS